MQNLWEHVHAFDGQECHDFSMERDLRRRIYVLRGLGVLLTGFLSCAAVNTPVGASGILPPNNPVANITPSPNFLSSGVCSVSALGAPCANPCVRVGGSGANRRAKFPAFDDAPACTQFILRSLNNARADEDLAPIVLPTNWYRLRPPEQIFVIVDLERTARGLPPYLGLNRLLHAAAQYGAAHETDPAYAKGFAVGLDAGGVRGMGSTLAMGYSPLEADYVWMYDDGWGGSSSLTPNLACTFLGALGCWGHRDQLLGYDGSYNYGVGLHCRTCEMGTGFAITNHAVAFTSLIELPAGPPPPMYFTWAKNVAPFLVH